MLPCRGAQKLLPTYLPTRPRTKQTRAHADGASLCRRCTQPLLPFPSPHPPRSIPPSPSPTGPARRRAAALPGPGKSKAGVRACAHPRPARGSDERTRRLRRTRGAGPSFVITSVPPRPGRRPAPARVPARSPKLAPRVRGRAGRRPSDRPSWPTGRPATRPVFRRRDARVNRSTVNSQLG